MTFCEQGRSRSNFSDFSDKAIIIRSPSFFPPPPPPKKKKKKKTKKLWNITIWANASNIAGETQTDCKDIMEFLRTSIYGFHSPIHIPFVVATVYGSAKHVSNETFSDKRGFNAPAKSIEPFQLLVQKVVRHHVIFSSYDRNITRPILYLHHTSSLLRRSILFAVGKFSACQSVLLTQYLVGC